MRLTGRSGQEAAAESRDGSGVKCLRNRRKNGAHREGERLNMSGRSWFANERSYFTKKMRQD